METAKEEVILIAETEQSILDELVEKSRTTFHAQFINALILFIHAPVRLFEMLQQRKFDVVPKPFPFFLSCISLSFLLCCIAEIYFEPSWREMYDHLDTNDKIAFNAAFTGEQREFTSLDSVEYAMHRSLKYYETRITGKQLVEFMEPNNAALAHSIEMAYINTEAPYWKQTFSFFASLLLVVVPWACLFHFLLRTKTKTLKQTIHHSLYMFGMFLLFALPVAYLIDPYNTKIDFLWLAFMSAVFYLFVQDILILKKTHEVKTWKVIVANLVTNCVFFIPIVLTIYELFPQ